MTDHGHGDDQHDHHQHELSWADELAQLRDAARHYYLHQFDWKGQDPPPGFDGPRFFEPDKSWVRQAWLDRSATGAGQPVELATSTGQIRNMTVAGQLVFEAGGAEHRLTGFLTHGADGYEVLFVPFRDATSGDETYGAGRYLEVGYEPDQETVELDFNYAYNPSCVYSTAYDCPYPPPANRLTIPVRAGEMMPAKGTEQ
jgi:uncharacterized protein